MLTTRFSLAIGSFTWAILLLWPGVLFTPARTTYRIMSEMADERIWALAFLAHAVSSMYLLLVRKPSIRHVVWSSFVGCFLWTLSTVACFASHYISLENYAPPAAMSADVALALASWWYFVKLNVLEHTKCRIK